MRPGLTFVLRAAVATLLLSAPVSGQVATDAATARLASVSWLAGHWVGATAGGQHIEEMWMPAHDEHMIGAFRWERGQARWLFEFMSLEMGTLAAPTPLTLRLKHFDRGLVGMEDKTVSTTLIASEVSAARIVFALTEKARAVRLTYTLRAPDRLDVVFEETESGKPATRIEFPYRRLK